MKRAFLLFGLAILMCASAAAQQQARRAKPDSPARSEVYVKWLDEDVAYIITPEERRAFQMLKSDEQREEFINAFWRRRDPNLDTETNEYRDEHYGRVAHANEHYAAPNAAGWKTDRGRIHIMYGKPHSVSKTSDGEVWVYRVLPGVGTNIEIKFVLDTATGDLRLQKPN